MDACLLGRPIVSSLLALAGALIAAAATFAATSDRMCDDAPGESTPQRPTESLVGTRQPGDIVVASFNIRYGTAGDGKDHWSLRGPRCLEAIRRLDADVLGLQEALHLQVVEIAAALPKHTIVGVGRDDGAMRGEHCAIVIRDDAFETLERGTFWLSDTPKEPGSRTFGNQITRICTWALLRHRLTDATIRVLNVHLDHRSEESRVHSAALLVRRMASMPPTDATILLGDLNSGPESAAFRALLEPIVPSSGPPRGGSPVPFMLRDTWRVIHPDAPEPEGTFHAFRGTAVGPRIDVVFASDQLSVRAAAIDRRPVDGRWPSDHFPVMARVRVAAIAP